MAIGANIMPKNPSIFAPTYTDINVASGCIPSDAPNILGSKKLRARFNTKNIVISPIAILKFLPTITKAQGNITIPEPTKGIASNKDIKAATPIGFLTLIMKKPMLSRQNDISINSMYALIYLIIVVIV